MKIVATILLDDQDHYVYTDGTLPIRPEFDKELLTAIVSDMSVSFNGYKMLPPGIQKLVVEGSSVHPITIPEIDSLAEILIVSRGQSKTLEGKKFKFNKFSQILKEGRIEIWILKKKH